METWSCVHQGGGVWKMISGLATYMSSPHYFKKKNGRNKKEKKFIY